MNVQWIWCVSLSLVIGCVQARPDSTDVTSEVADAADSGVQPEVGATLPWRSSSTHVAVTSYGSFDGESRFEAERAELTARQLRALERLRLQPNPTRRTCCDSVSYTVRITDQNGFVASYSVQYAEGTGRDGVLEHASLLPFLATFSCLHSRALVAGTSPYSVSIVAISDAGASSDAGAAPWSAAPSVSAEQVGCFHALRGDSSCFDTWLQLDVRAPGAYELRTGDCLETLGLVVWSPDGSRELASASGTSPACPTLAHTFAEAGSYPLRLRKTNVAGCATNAEAPRTPTPYLRILPQTAH